MVLSLCFNRGCQNKSALLKSKRIVLRFDMRKPLHEFFAYQKPEFFVYGV